MSKKTLIMIHGFRGTHHGLQKIVEALPDEYRTIVPDLPGFGEAKPLKKHDLESYVTWLHDFIKTQDLSEPPILLGHSFGSIIASAYAAQFPNTIKKLILVNPIGAPALEGPKAVMTKLAIFYYWLGEKLPSKVAGQWLGAKPIVMIMSVTMAKTKDKQLRQYIHNQHLTYFSRFHSPKSVSEAFKTSTQNSVRDTAPNVQTPTLLIAGDKDDITPLQKQHELEALFPNASLQVIANVGHLTHYETPKEVSVYISDFIE